MSEGPVVDLPDGTPSSALLASSKFFSSVFTGSPAATTRVERSASALTVSARTAAWAWAVLRSASLRLRARPINSALVEASRAFLLSPAALIPRSSACWPRARLAWSASFAASCVARVLAACWSAWAFLRSAISFVSVSMS